MSKAKEFLDVNEEISEAEVLKKVKEMIKDDSGWLLNKCKQLLKSGGVDPAEFANDLSLPKILYYAALGDLRDNRKPLDKKYLQMAKNLSNF